MISEFHHVLEYKSVESMLNYLLALAAKNCQTPPLLQYIFLHRGACIHCLPISTRIEYKVFLIFLKAQMKVASKYIRNVIRLPTSASSLRPLRSLERRELFVPRTMAKSRSFSVAGPSI